MAFQLASPYPLLETVTVLPNPQFGDSEAATGTLEIKRTVTGRRRTYVKSRGGRRKLQWSFKLTRNKALEFLEFYRSYHSQLILVEDHNGRNWLGYIMNNPFEIEMASRGLPSRQGWPVGETCTVEVEFEGMRTQETIEDETPMGRSLNAPAFNELNLLRQNTFLEKSLPTFGSALQNNWDAIDGISGVQDNTPLSVWPDSGPANNDLIGRIGGVFNPTIDRTPNYMGSSLVLNSRPSVRFSNVSNGQGSDTAAMVTTSDMSVFPARRGTLFWVMAHTVGNDFYSFYENAIQWPWLYAPGTADEQLQLAIENPSSINNATEFGVLGLQDQSGGANVEQVHFSGTLSPFTPVNGRFQPADVANDIRLVTTFQDGVPNMIPHIFCVQRNLDGNIRFRVNGIEREGATILNNPGYFGKFYVNDQPWVPQFNAKIRGEWGQILVYNRALQDLEIEQVEDYLSTRWGIALNQVTF